MIKKILIPFIILVGFVCSIAACKKTNKEDTKLPKINIDSIVNITLTSADVNINVFFSGATNITKKGICWSLNQNPTISDAHTDAGPGSGTCFNKMTGLVKGNTYYVRGYATNDNGTAYSGQLTVKAGTVTDIDNNVYDLVTINGKTWIAGNLRVTKFRNGEAIPYLSSSADWRKAKTSAYCYVNNVASTKNDYGLLYNWYAAADTRGICPKGFKTLVSYAYKSLGNGGSGGSGGPLKTTGTTFWKTPNTDATNSSGFSAKGTGYRDSAGTYFKFNELSYFWDVDYFASKNAYVAWLEFDSGDFTTDYWTLDKRYGLCVRCFK